MSRDHASLGGVVKGARRTTNDPTGNGLVAIPAGRAALLQRIILAPDHCEFVTKVASSTHCCIAKEGDHIGPGRHTWRARPDAALRSSAIPLRGVLPMLVHHRNPCEPAPVALGRGHDRAAPTDAPVEVQSRPVSPASDLTRLVRSALDWLARKREEQITEDVLMRLSDRSLADIGIAREDIPLIAKGLDPTDPNAAESVFARWRRERREYQQVWRELMAHSEQELGDLGIRRCDIPFFLRPPTGPRAA
jgi:uncharacterized protein YjiS (DUF1127 family)